MTTASPEGPSDHPQDSRPLSAELEAVEDTEQILEVILESLMDRIQAGEQPDIEEYVRLHPGLADEVRSLAGMLSLVNADPEQQEAGRPKSLGGYRILSELGRGGMGIVYLARHQSLGRNSALKVLSPAYAEDAHYRERFRREAGAAAALHHSNIVPIFEIGEENQTLWYSMQCIRGRSLLELREELSAIMQETGRPVSTIPDFQAAPAAARSGDNSDHSLTGGKNYFKEIADIGIQAADALSYAHSRGIIHRDVKPSNLIIDDQSVVWLTDFGLARTDDSDITRSGQLLGTTRYMAPERFQGECDAAADQYALAATLYELIALRPVFAARDSLQLIDQIRNSTPVRLREIDQRVPRDLEVILTKGLEKDPRHRYPTTREFKDDLQRFRTGQPITVRPATVSERVRKWAVRNPATSLMLSLFILAVISGLSVSSWKWWEAARERDQKIIARDRWKANSLRAREAVDRMLEYVGDVRLNDIPGMQSVRRELMEDAIDFHREFLTESDDPALRSDMAETHMRLGHIYRLLSEYKKAEASYTECEALLLSLSDMNYEPRKTDIRLAAALRDKGLARLESGDSKTAEQEMQRALDSLETIPRIPAEPDRDVELSRTLTALARLSQRAGNFRRSASLYNEAENTTRTLLQTAPANFDHQATLQSILVMQSRSLMNLDELGAAEQKVGEALRVSERLLEARPDSRAQRDAYAVALQQHYAVLQKQGRSVEAKEAIEACIVQFTRLRQDFPHIIEYGMRAANSSIGMAISLSQQGMNDEAEPRFVAAYETLREMAERFPKAERIRGQLFNAERILGIFFLNSGQAKRAVTPLQSVLARLQTQLEGAPEDFNLMMQAVSAAHGLGVAYRSAEQLSEAARSTETALSLALRAASTTGMTANIRHNLAQDHRQLAEIRADLGDVAAAEEHYSEAIRMAAAVVAESPETAAHYYYYGCAVHSYASWLCRRKRYDAALKEAERAVDILAPSPSEPEKSRNDHIEHARSLHTLGRILRESETDTHSESFAEAAAAFAALLAETPSDDSLMDQWLECCEVLTTDLPPADWPASFRSSTETLLSLLEPEHNGPELQPRIEKIRTCLRELPSEQ